MSSKKSGLGLVPGASRIGARFFIRATCPNPAGWNFTRDITQPLRSIRPFTRLRARIRYGAGSTSRLRIFVFSCKLPREITHQCKLRDCSAELGGFLRAVEPLVPKLHIILIQLPPSFLPKEGKVPLRSFVEQLPRDFRFAIEFRHPGWHRPQFIHLLEKHRICWVWADTSPLNQRNLAPFEFQPRTTDFLYVRLLGDYTTKYDRDGKHRHRYGKLLWKREAAMESWALKIERQLSDVRAVYAYVNNHFEGFALESAQRLAERLGYELPLPSTEAQTSAEDRKQLDLQL